MQQKERARRLHVRLRCSVGSDGAEVSGFTYDLSTTGAYLRLSPTEARERTLQPGVRLRLSLRLAEAQRPLELPCEVVWAEPEDHDINGQEAFGLALRFVALPPPSEERLAAFLKDFRYTVVCLDDEPHTLELVERALRNDYRVITCHSADEVLAALGREDVAVLLSDHRMPSMTGLQFFKRVREQLPHAQTSKIVLSGYSDPADIQEFVIETSIQAYLTKPFDARELQAAVRRAADVYAMTTENLRLRAELERVNLRLRRENDELRQRVEAGESLEAIISVSGGMRRILDTVRQVAATEATVLIRGETGTGKELVAQALHRLSRRAEAPFVAVNCAALPETLIESELFGHERGAFTGAHKQLVGRFERAHHGTICLDEIGDVPLPAQVKLLRVLQEGTFERLGGTEPMQVDVRVIAATHRDLERMVEEGRFRKDLFYRLDVIPLQLPPLRQRPDDIWPLCEHYLAHFQAKMGKRGISLSPRKRAALEAHAWPGNVRELINAIERIVALTPSDTMDDSELADVSPFLVGGAAKEPQGPLRPLLDAYEKSIVTRVLARHGGNRTHAARELGLSRQALSQKIGKLGL